MDLRAFVRILQRAYPDPPGADLKSVNGLQVESGPTVSRVAFGVFLNDELISRAVEAGADAIVCHHGFSGVGFFSVTGPRRNQLKTLMGHGVSVIGIDEAMLLHAERPTAALLAESAGLSVSRMVGSAALCAQVSREAAPAALARLLLDLYPPGQGLDEFRTDSASLEKGLREALLAGDWPRAPGLFGPARVFGAWRPGPGACRALIAPGCHSLQTVDIYEMGADLYVVGEVREHLMAEAWELGISVVCVGHYYSERPGVLRALRVAQEGVQAEAAAWARAQGAAEAGAKADAQADARADPDSASGQAPGQKPREKFPAPELMFIEVPCTL